MNTVELDMLLRHYDTLSFTARIYLGFALRNQTPIAWNLTRAAQIEDEVKRLLEVLRDLKIEGVPK